MFVAGCSFRHRQAEGDRPDLEEGGVRGRRACLEGEQGVWVVESGCRTWNMIGNGQIQYLDIDE